MIIKIMPDKGNRKVKFLPLGMYLRGRIQANRAANPAIREHYGELLADVPGQILCLDTEAGKGWIEEPLIEDPQFRELKGKIEARKFLIEPHGKTTLFAADVPTWLYWMHRLIENKSARLVEGTFPQKLPGTPRKNFLASTLEEPEAPTNGHADSGQVKALIEQNAVLAGHVQQLIEQNAEVLKQQAATLKQNSDLVEMLVADSSSGKSGKGSRGGS